MKNDGVRVCPRSKTRVSLSKDAYMPVCLKRAVSHRTSMSYYGLSE